MSITMSQLDSFIDAAISSMSGERGTFVKSFFIDLRSLQQRITTQLVDSSIAICASRGLRAERNGDGLVVTVNLHTAFLNPSQTIAFNTALAYTREVHGNNL